VLSEAGCGTPSSLAPPDVLEVLSRQLTKERLENGHEEAGPSCPSAGMLMSIDVVSDGPRRLLHASLDAFPSVTLEIEETGGHLAATRVSLEEEASEDP